jgi:hypothetical protein
MPKNIAFFLCLGCLLPTASFTQDLSKAAQDYFLHDHFAYKPEIIAQSKIKSIESHWYYFSNDTINQAILIEKNRFNQLGKPEYRYKKPIGLEKSEIYFFYDSSGNLIKEEQYGIAPSLTYKLIATHEWSYTNGTLKRHRHFLLLDKIDVDHGGSYFPEKIFLYNNDTLVYNLIDTSVVLLTNRAEHCNDVAAGLYPTTFKTPLTITLKFHPNSKIRLKTIVRESIVQNTLFDQCGNPINGLKANKKCQTLLKEDFPCLPLEKITPCNNADTITINGQLLYFIKTNSSFFQHDSGAGTTYNHSGICYYDQDFRLLSANDTTQQIRGSMWDNIPSYSNQTIRKSRYEYFDNGLLKKITVTDEKGSLVEVTEFKLEYF